VESKRKRKYSPEFEAISAAEYKQEGGMKETPQGDVSLIDLDYKD
jgi:hypothetical protein